MMISNQLKNTQATVAPAIRLTGGTMVKHNFTAQSKASMLDPQARRASQSDIEKADNLDRVLNDPSMAILRNAASKLGKKAAKAAATTVKNKLTSPGPHWTDVPAEAHRQSEKHRKHMSRPQHNSHYTHTDSTGTRHYKYDNSSSSSKRR
ncbi:hypothetical protein [Agarilytica rhodophyticola]|uniref:hypothetical protein n=1 Tax=Agarilytica rhodophyticola TaxID=1737490 RepID=UPI000CD9990E|nr:hypothetical protein [Agarilytica rhodophyticola]